MKYDLDMKANTKLLDLFNRTIKRLENENDRFNWGHFGRCNCGFLAQEATKKTPLEIHQAALEKRGEDWGVRVENYCDNSGLDIDEIVRDLLRFGLSSSDLVRLEKLNDPKVLNYLDSNEPLEKGCRQSSIRYFKAFRNYVEAELKKSAVIV